MVWNTSTSPSLVIAFPYSSRQQRGSLLRLFARYRHETRPLAQASTTSSGPFLSRGDQHSPNMLCSYFSVPLLSLAFVGLSCHVATMSYVMLV